MATKTKEKQKMHIKTGDRVMIIAGKDKGKTGNVKKVILEDGKVVVEGVNIVTKAMKPNPMRNIPGGFVKLEAPINVSNVMLYCQKCDKPTRVSYKVLEDGKKTRVCKECSEQIDI